MHYRYNYGVVGEKQVPIVLLHGLGVGGRYMVPLANALVERGQPVFVPDLPGFGRSKKPAHILSLRELVDALYDWLDVIEMPSAVLLGNSFGCQMLLEFAVHYPAKVRELVLVGPTMDRYARTTLRQFGRLLIDCVREPPGQPLIVARDYLRCGPVRFWKTFRTALADEPESKAPHVTAPTLVIRGTRDPIVSQEWAQELTELLPNGALQLIPGPHALNYASPEPLADALLAFIRRNKVYTKE